MRILLTYGTRQRFRPRHGDLNVIGCLRDAAFPVASAAYRLNEGAPRGFYVEHVPDPGLDWTREYKDSPAILRLKDQGDFNVEIPVASPELRPGANTLVLDIEDANGMQASVSVDLARLPNGSPGSLKCVTPAATGRYGTTHQAMAVASISIRYSGKASRATPSSVLDGLQLPFSSRIIIASQLLSNSSTSVV